MTARSEYPPALGQPRDIDGCSPRELDELVRQLAREGLRDHEIAHELSLKVEDVRRVLGAHAYS